ncbi:MAG: amino acid ABC transporter substrate-binding protein [Deltaproteobacteria bacterium]|jgi:ABC-type amino acid transport substrate-binding protein|nr:amino acid ABC transporter substrate-binding protein [Deltaproteobacteria bacterium]
MKRPALRLALGSWLVATLAVAALPALAADPTPAALRAPERIAKAGVLRVAIDATYPPMEFEGSDGKATGFDVDLATDLARRLGVRAEFVVMNWDGILAGLTSSRYDVIVSSMNVTPERKAVADFVEYLQMAQVVVAKPGSNVKSTADLAGKVVAVQADTTSHQAVLKAKADGVAIKDVKAFQLATQAFQALKAGQAEAIVIDEPVARYYAKRDAASFQVTGQALAPEPVGMAVKKPGGELVQALAAALEAARADGTFQRISETWFGTVLGAAAH